MLNIYDSGKSFEIHLGDVITVHLNENPTTPYRWVLDKETNNNILSFVESHYALPENPQFGEGGIRSLIFKTKSEGAATIQLKHWCAWEGESSIIERFEVTILVKE